MPNYTDHDIAHFISEVNENAEKELTPWETSFMESITDKWERTHRLTERQIEILDRIYSEKTA